MADDTKGKLPYGSLKSESAKKRRRIETRKARDNTRIALNTEFTRWEEMRQRKGFVKHEDMARFLMDNVERVEHMPEMIPSTPMAKPQRHSQSTPLSQSTDVHTRSAYEGPGVSEISEESHDQYEIESEFSGVEAIEQQSQHQVEVPLPQPDESSLYVDPFELTIEASEQIVSSDWDEDDEDYVPSFDMSIRPKTFDAAEETSFATLEFGDNVEEDDDDSEDEEETACSEGPGIYRVTNPEYSETISTEDMFLVSRSCLFTLARKRPDSCCKVKGCGLNLDINTSVTGSAVYLKWVCERKHVNYSWCSQPILNRRLHSGDLLSALAILTSGNNFSKVALFARNLSLHFPSISTFNHIQRTYLVPSINQFWIDHQQEYLSSFMDQAVIVSGDGRMDSPGHSAQYCTYSMMETTTNKILTIATVDKRETDRKSTLMEKLGFERAMADLKDKNITVGEVVTDQHIQIAALMRNKYPEIKHSFDVWHAAKNLAKKINAVGSEKGNRDLLKWTKDIANHFWYACQVAETVDEFRGVFFGVIQHVQNSHSWKLPYGAGLTKCLHGPLTDDDSESKWLTPGGSAHLALEKIILDPSLAKKVPHLLNCRSTAELENFNQLVLMYAAKRFAYTPPVYKARTQLAAMDHNENSEREVKRNKDGTIRYHRVYNKKTARWSAYPMKEEKSYDYLDSLKVNVLHMRLSDRKGMQEKRVLAPDDPRRISLTLAPVEPPPTAELVQRQKSRLEKK